MFPKDLDVSRQVKILKKTTTLLNLQNMFCHLQLKMTEVSVETCFANLRVLSFSLKLTKVVPAGKDSINLYESQRTCE